IVDEITNTFIENNERGNTKRITCKEKIEDIIQSAEKDPTKHSDVIKNIETESSVCSSSVLSEFNKRIECASYPENIEEEHKKMLNTRIRSAEEQGIEKWKYKSNALKIKKENTVHADKLNDWTLKKVREFGMHSKNKTLPQNDAIEALTKQFSEQFKREQIDLKRALEGLKKTSAQCIKNTFEILLNICKGQRMTERLLDSKVLNEIYNSPNPRDRHIFEMNADGKEQETIVNTMKGFVTLDPELARKKKAEFEQNRTCTKKGGFFPSILGYSGKKGDCSDMPSFEEALEADIIQHVLKLFGRLQPKLREVTNFDGNRLDIDKIKSAIHEIQECINTIDKDLNRPNNYSFRHVCLKAEINRFLFKQICIKIERDDVAAMEDEEKSFAAEEKSLTEVFLCKLKATLGDQETANAVFTIIDKSLRDFLQEKAVKDIAEKVKKETCWDNGTLTDETNNVVFFANDDDIFNFATNTIKYMEDHYKRMFNKKKKNILETARENISKDYKNRCNKLKENISKCRSDIFERIKTKDAPSEEEKTQIGQIFYQVFKAYMINKNINTMLKQNSLFVQIPDNTYFNNRTAMEEEALFSRKYDTTDKSKDSFNKIENSSAFFDFLLKRCEENVEKIKKLEDEKSEIIELVIDKVEKELSAVMHDNLIRAMGCRHTCPYCGVKCSLPNDDHDKHSANKHRLMGFNGTWQADFNGNKEFLTDCCDSGNNINSYWKMTTASVNERDGNCQKKDVELRERLRKENATFGELNFNLQWKDPNDLDLHVTCPCNSHIYFSSRECSTCKGYLDVDMNVGDKCDAIAPIEHVYFKDNAKEGLYKIQVHLFSYGKSYNGRTGGTSSKFTLTVTNKNSEPKQLFTGEVSANQCLVAYEYNHSLCFSFDKHCRENYPSWKITMRPASISNLEHMNALGIALNRISGRLKKHYNI
ncbi:SAP DNA-binding domain-containing protein, partial [Reticulomyxa filosa]